MTATYKQMKMHLGCALDDLTILAGDKAGPSGSSWQDVALTCAAHLDHLSAQLKEAARGNAEAFIVFPSPSDFLEDDGVEADDRCPKCNSLLTQADIDYGLCIGCGATLPAGMELDHGDKDEDEDDKEDDKR